MPTPDFVLRLREKIGHDLLPLVGACAVVLDDEGRLLLSRRRDTGRWALIGGIVEPGEQPALTAVREVFEETAVEAEVVRLVSVVGGEPMEYPNGDRVQVLSLTFVLRRVSGDAHVADDENLEVGWFAIDERPELTDWEETRLARALAAPAPTYYEV